MKHLLVMALLATMGSKSFATDGKTAGCFDVAVSVPKAIDKNGPTSSSLVKTGAVLCVTESNMKDVDDVSGTGNIVITMRDHGREISRIELGAYSSEGAAGTIYTTYGLTLDDVGHMDDEAYKVALFAMRNDHLKKGQVSGRVKLFAQPELTLIER